MHSLTLPAPDSPVSMRPSARDVCLLQLLTTGSVLHTGGRHRARGQNGQDHVVTLQQREAVVLCVADGASNVNGAASRAEVGAALSAELAAGAAFDAACRGLGPGDLRAHVGAALVRQLAPLWHALGDSAAALLHCTLVLGVVTPEYSAVWCVGDGAWGAVGSLVRGRSLPRTRAFDFWSDGELWAAHSLRRAERLKSTVATICRDGDPAVATRGLECVLEAEGPALALYVASDGLEDEPDAADLLRGPVRSLDALRDALRRDENCDDLAVAFAAERRAGALGLGELLGDPSRNPSRWPTPNGSASTGGGT